MLRFDGLKVTALVADNSACGFYRCINPLWYLKKYGAETKHLNTCTLYDITDSDIIIAQRQYSLEVYNNVLKPLLDMKKTVIYECDDHLSSVSVDSPVYGVYHGGTPQLNTVNKIIRECTGITVSTYELASEYSSVNSNIYTLPNSIDFEMRNWEYEDPNRDDAITILYSGGVTHAPDLEILNDVMPFIFNKYPHVKLALYTSTQFIPKLMKDWKIPEDRLIIVNPKSFEDYPMGLAGFDIGLVPVVNSRFNSSKSNLKILEKGCKRIPCVASAAPPYVTTIVDGMNGFIAKTTGDWIKHLSTLIEDEQLRKKMGNKMYDIVHSDFDMDKNIHLWPAAWKSIRSNYLSNQFPPTLKSMWATAGPNDPCPCQSGQKYKKCSNGQHLKVWG